MSKLKLLFLDFESYYDDVYSLRNMSPAEYILDDKFEVSMVAVREGYDGKTFVIPGPEFAEWLYANYDPATTVTVTFNSLFDNCILAWEYGFVPFRMLDAMNMARALLGHKLTSLSLDAVGKYLGLGGKAGGGAALTSAKGVRYAALKLRSHAGIKTIWENMVEYAIHDVDLMVGIFQKLIDQFPKSEQRVMDLVLRCAVQPTFRVDKRVLIDHYKELRAAKAKLLEDAKLSDPKGVMSNSKFKQMLEDLGVEVVMKTSPMTVKQAPAFAKTDQFMEDLTNHPNPDVQALAAARLGHKSTLEETRTRKLLKIAMLPWQRYRNGKPRMYSGGTMPIPLRYSGAHTHRLSGDWGMNMQNLPRGSKLRRALIAPPGYVVMAADLAQIEARLVAWICGQWDLVKQFADKEDPYANLASSIFGFTVVRKIHKVEGFIGKTGILGLGFGCGFRKFYDMVVKLARVLKVDLTTVGWNIDLAQKTVETYRTRFSKIESMWNWLGTVLATAWTGRSGPVNIKSVTVCKNEVKLPNGLSLLYEEVPDPNLATPGYTPRSGEFWYRYGKFIHRLYGPKLLENIVQALARIIVMNAALRLADRGYRFILQAHDELVFLIRIEDIDNAKNIVYTEMTRRPSWARDLPLDADVKYGPNYGECK